MFEFWCEWDINPLIIFDENGNIKYCNQEAEILLSYGTKKEIFDFVIRNAPKQKGLKTKFEHIKFKTFDFTGYSIGYQNDKEIGIRLFINTSIHSIKPKELEKVDISSLLKFAIEYVTLKEQILITTYIDPTIPPILTNKKELLNIFLEILESQKEVEIITKINIGEYIKIENKKYPIIDIIFKTQLQKEIKSNCFEIIKNKNEYILKIPMIKENNEINNS